MQIDGRRITDDYAPQTRRMIAARLQAPRSLWDCNYVENSWVNDAAGGPICLLPRLRKMIATHYPGTKVAITEYSYGRSNDISGAIAQADVLGIFGREGVFAAALWPDVSGHAQASSTHPGETMEFSFAAFNMFLDYDGAGGHFGKIGLSATTSSSERTSAYASLDDAGRLVLVMLNKSAGALPAYINVRGGPRRSAKARIYTLTAAAPKPIRQADLQVSLPSFQYRLPPMSVTTLVLEP
jgi:hypothetical protein